MVEAERAELEADLVRNQEDYVKQFHAPDLESGSPDCLKVVMKKLV